MDERKEGEERLSKVTEGEGRREGGMVKEGGKEGW